jgi:hypothetical protein
MPYSIDHFSLNLINKLAPNIDHVAHWVEELRAKNPGFSDEAILERAQISKLGKLNAYKELCEIIDE